MIRAPTEIFMTVQNAFISIKSHRVFVISKGTYLRKHWSPKGSSKIPSLSRSAQIIPLCKIFSLHVD